MGSDGASLQTWEEGRHWPRWETPGLSWGGAVEMAQKWVGSGQTDL